MNRVQYVFIILISFFLNEIHGNITFKNIGLEEGISNNWVFAVKRDSHGYLWIGTMNGINRWDGYSMKTYYHHPTDSNSISSNVISSFPVSSVLTSAIFSFISIDLLLDLF